MNEIYEYLKGKISGMYDGGKTEVTIDMAHAFRIFHMICDMKHIRAIINQEEDMMKTLKELKSREDKYDS